MTAPDTAASVAWRTAMDLYQEAEKLDDRANALEKMADSLIDVFVDSRIACACRRPQPEPRFPEPGPVNDFGDEVGPGTAWGGGAWVPGSMAPANRDLAVENADLKRQVAEMQAQLILITVPRMRDADDQ